MLFLWEKGVGKVGGAPVAQLYSFPWPPNLCENPGPLHRSQNLEKTASKKNQV